MRSILFHARKFNTEITGLSTRGIDVAPEESRLNPHDHKDCIVVFITVEDKDIIDSVVPKIAKEILKFCVETGDKHVVLCPFAHLSRHLASFKFGIEFFDKLENELGDKLEVSRVHFGSDKDLLLHLFGHPGNARYREF